MNLNQSEEKNESNPSKMPLHFYSLAPELKTQAAATLFFDANDKIALLDKNLSITELRLFLVLATYCEPETNICSFKVKDRLSILISLSKHGFEYEEETIKGARKNLTKNGFIASLKATKRGYIMLNPSIVYYGGTKSTSRFRYGNRKQVKNQRLETVRGNRIKDFLQLRDKDNPIAQEQAAEKLFEIYTENIESKYMSTYTSR